jgi:hypothetical protein
LNAKTASFATTGSNIFIGTQTITGSVLQSGSFTTTGTIIAQTINVQTVTSSIIYSSGSNIFGNTIANTQTFTGSVNITGSLSLNSITIPTSASLASTYLQLAGGTLTGDLSIAYTTSNLRLFLNNTTATTGRSWYLNSFSNGNLYIGNTTAGDIFNFSSAGAATFSSNVGIGNTDPQYKTQITSTSANNVTNVLGLHNGSNPAGAGTGVRLLFKLSNFETAAETRKFASIEGISTADYNEAIDLVFKTKANNSDPAERLRINSVGNATFSSLGTGTVTATSGTLSTASDMNLKDEDGFIDNALEKVMNLKPRYFHWKKESGLPTDLRQLGFYAQEVNEALGEEAANTPKNENDNWGIYDRGIIAMLTKAIQEQNQTIQELSNRLIKLESK